MKEKSKLPQRFKVSVGLHRKVICPICGKEGLLTSRQRNKKWYLYVRHPVKEGNKWRIVEHYVGPARFFYVSTKFLKRPLVKIECIAKRVDKDEDRPLVEESFLSFTSVVLENDAQEISFLRQLALDYLVVLLWLKEVINQNLDEIKKKFGITNKEIEYRMKELKEEFITVTFYKK